MPHRLCKIFTAVPQVAVQSGAWLTGHTAASELVRNSSWVGRKRQSLAIWSSGTILASVARGPGFSSQNHRTPVFEGSKPPRSDQSAQRQ